MYRDIISNLAESCNQIEGLKIETTAFKRRSFNTQVPYQVMTYGIFPTFVSERLLRFYSKTPNFLTLCN